VNWYGIFALKMLGLAWDIKRPRLQAEASLPMAAD
jgi:hypothetical protein